MQNRILFPFDLIYQDRYFQQILWVKHQVPIFNWTMKEQTKQVSKNRKKMNEQKASLHSSIMTSLPFSLLHWWLIGVLFVWGCETLLAFRRILSAASENQTLLLMSERDCEDDFTSYQNSTVSDCHVLGGGSTDKRSAKTVPSGAPRISFYYEEA